MGTVKNLKRTTATMLKKYLDSFSIPQNASSLYVCLRKNPLSIDTLYAFIMRKQLWDEKERRLSADA